METTFFDEIRRNKTKSLLLVILFFLFVGLIGAAIGYYWFAGAPGGWEFGVLLAVVVGTAYFLISWFAGDKMVLATTGAKPVTKQTHPYLVHTVEGLALAAGIPAPQCYVIEDSALNAYATGIRPEKSAIVVTTGLLKTMNRQELEGVIAHEMSHVKNYDIRVMLLTAVLVGVTTLLADIFLRSLLFGRSNRDREGGQLQFILLIAGLILVILSPLIAQLIKLAISRKREYLADASGAMLTRYPPGLASALRKIKADPDPLVDKANRATAHLFISTPFRKRKGFLTGLFSTHPPIEERIRRLEAM